jgi:hypothetical protein
MPTLRNLLNEQDQFFLEMLANIWGIENTAVTISTIKADLIAIMKSKNVLDEMIEALPENAKTAFNTILDNDGHISWAKFCRDFGDVRVMGASKRDRERPDLNPISPSEILWYRGLIGKAFLNIRNEPLEYAYIPNEIFELIHPNNNDKIKSFSRLSYLPEQIDKIKAVDDSLLQDACTILAGLRKGLSESQIQEYLWEVPYRFLTELLLSANIISSDGQLDSDAVRLFLEAPRAEAWLRLYEAWLACSSINEITHLPEIVIEGKIDNNPPQTRSFLLEKVFETSSDAWWNLEDFVENIHQSDPDFQRPAGNYDTWIIKQANKNEYMRGYQFWDQVEGQLIRYMINGPFHWIGIVDLGCARQETGQRVFKLSSWADDLRSKQPPKGLRSTEEKPKLDSYGKITVPGQASPAVRYQISRFCDWEVSKSTGYNFRVSADSLSAVGQHGLKASHLLTLLQKTAEQPIPPNLKTLLENWEKHGAESLLTKETLLRVKEPEIISKLQKTPSGKFIKEIITPTIALLNQGTEEKVRQALLELGYFSDWKIN